MVDRGQQQKRRMIGFAFHQWILDGVEEMLMKIIIWQKTHLVSLNCTHVVSVDLSEEFGEKRRNRLYVFLSKDE